MIPEIGKTYRIEYVDDSTCANLSYSGTAKCIEVNEQIGINDIPLFGFDVPNELGICYFAEEDVYEEVDKVSA